MIKFRFKVDKRESCIKKRVTEYNTKKKQSTPLDRSLFDYQKCDTVDTRQGVIDDFKLFY